MEAVWSHLKRSLANLIKTGIDELTALAKTRLRWMRYRNGLIDGATEFDELTVGRRLPVEQGDAGRWWMNIGGATVWIGADRDGCPGTSPPPDQPSTTPPLPNAPTSSAGPIHPTSMFNPTQSEHSPYLGQRRSDLAVNAQQHLHAVTGPLGDLCRRDSGIQPRGDRSVPLPGAST